MSLDVLLAAAILALGTYLIRLAGVSSSRISAPVPGEAGESGESRPPEALAGRAGPVRHLADEAVAVLLAGVIVVTTLYDGVDLAGGARVLGVLVGAVAALLRMPLVVVVLVAAVCTAVLRALGLG